MRIIQLILYHTYLNFPSNVSIGLDEESEVLGRLYFRIFTSRPATDNQTANPQNFHEAKSAEDFDLRPATWARAGQPVPTGSITFTADEADTAKALKVAVEETTPPSSGGTPTASPSNITFVLRGSSYDNFINAHGFSLIGSRSVPNNNWLGTFAYATGSYRNIFLESLTKQKTPIAIEVDGNSYNLSFNSFYNGSTESPDNGVTTKALRFDADNIPSNDRVSATDLTKAINFELVDNEQVTLVDNPANNQFDNTNIATGPFSQIFYYKSNNRFFNSRNKWRVEFRSTPTKTPTHIVINGREYPISLGQSPAFYDTDSGVTDTGFIPTSSNLSFGINVKFSDGTYANNTRSHLFQTGTAPTPEVKVQKVLTKAGVVDWLNLQDHATSDGQIPTSVLCGKKMDGTDKILTSSEFTALTSKPTGTIFCVEVPE